MNKNIPFDQARMLRERFEQEEAKSFNNAFNFKAISFTSGKGGVGKTNSVVNLGIQLSKLGKKVFLVDADLGLANIDILLKVSPKHTIEDVLTGKKNINDVIIEGPAGVHILPASSGISEMTDLTKDQQMLILKELSTLQSKYDFFLIDTGAGIASSVLRFNASADEICIVTTPEPTSMTDAYALMKIMTTRYQIRTFNIIVNKATPSEARNVIDRLNAVTQRFLPVSLVFYGNIPLDRVIDAAVRRQIPISLYKPNCSISMAYKNIAQKMISDQSNSTVQKESFWKKMANWKRSSEKL